MSSKIELKKLDFKDYINFFNSEFIKNIINKLHISQKLKNFITNPIYRYQLHYNRNDVKDIFQEFSSINIFLKHAYFDNNIKLIINEIFFGITDKNYFNDVKNCIIFEKNINELFKKYLFDLFKEYKFHYTIEGIRRSVDVIKNVQF